MEKGRQKPIVVVGPVSCLPFARRLSIVLLPPFYVKAKLIAQIGQRCGVDFCGFLLTISDQLTE